MNPSASAAFGLYARLHFFTVDIFARAGGGSGGGHSGGGGSSSSGGSSSGGGLISSGSSGYGSGAGGAASAIAGLIFGGVCLFFVIIFILFAMRTARRRGASGEQVGLGGQPSPGGASSLQGMALGSNAAATQVTTRADVDAALAQIDQRDPGFNEADFLSDCNRAFFTIQQAWTERKPEISRQVMHDGIWQQHKFQIDQYLSLNKQNVLENLAIQNTRVVSAHTDDAFDTLVVRFFASCADYDIDLSNDKHKMIRGDRTNADWAEDWVFQRKAGAITKPNGGTMAKKCPNCGAPLDLDLAGVCKYCRAPVMSGEFDWVLTRIEQLPDYEYAQQTTPN